MKSIYVYIDDFNSITKSTQNNIEKIREELKNNPEIKGCAIIVKDDMSTDILNTEEKKSLLNKILPKDVKFIVTNSKLGKLFKILRKLDYKGFKTVKIFCNPIEKGYIEGGLKGLPVDVESVEGHDLQDELKDAIMNNKYQKFINLMPGQLYDEFEWFKEKYNNMLENITKDVKNILKESV